MRRASRRERPISKVYEIRQPKRFACRQEAKEEPPASPQLTRQLSDSMRRPLGAKLPKSILVFCALSVRAIFGHHHDAGAHGDMWRNLGADAVRQHGGLVG